MKNFKIFTKEEIYDAIEYTEVIVALFVENRNKVDQMITQVIEAGKAGGKESRQPQDYGGCTDVVLRILTDISGK